MLEHDDIPGADPENLTDKDERDFDRSLSLIQAQRRSLAREQWIADEFEFIERELVRLRAIKRPRGKQPAIFLQTPSDVLDAVKLGVVLKNEARKLLGLRARKQPAGLRRAKAR